MTSVGLPGRNTILGIPRQSSWGGPMPDISRLIGRMVAPDETRPKWLRYGLAVILAILSFLPSWLIFNFNKAPYFSLFTMAVVITSLYGGRNPGLLCTAVSTVLAFFACSPAWTVVLADPED